MERGREIGNGMKEGRGLHKGFSWVFRACGCHGKLMHVQRHVPAASASTLASASTSAAPQIPNAQANDAEATRETKSAAAGDRGVSVCQGVVG